MPTTGPTRVDTIRCGVNLAQALYVVRSDGITVAPFKNGLFRVGDGAAMTTCGKDDIQGMAARINDKRRAAATKRKTPVVGTLAPGEDVAAWSNEPAGDVLAKPLQGRMANAGDGGETAATRGRPSPPVSAMGNSAHGGERHDAPINLRVFEADGRTDATDGPSASSSEGLQRRARRGTAGRAGQDVRDSGTSLECHVGERGDHSAAGRHAPNVDMTPTLEVARTAPPPAASRKQAVALTCQSCGGARSKWSVALCRKCYAPSGRKPDAAPPTADVSNKFASLADMVASRTPAPVAAPTRYGNHEQRIRELEASIRELEERDAAKDRAIAELCERLDQFTSEGR